MGKCCSKVDQAVINARKEKELSESENIYLDKIVYTDIKMHLSFKRHLGEGGFG